VLVCGSYSGDAEDSRILESYTQSIGK